MILISGLIDYYDWSELTIINSGLGSQSNYGGILNLKTTAGKILNWIKSKMKVIKLLRTSTLT